MDETFDCQLQYWNGPGSAKVFAHPVNFTRLQNLLKSTSAIVEVGCGRGRVLESLFDHGFRNLTGFDAASAMVEQARYRLPTLSFETIVPPHLPVPDASVDGVLLFAVLTCIPTNHGQQALIREIQRVLQPGGLLYISDYWLQGDARNRQRYKQFASEFGTYGVFRLPEGAVFRHHERTWIQNLTSAFQPAAIDEIRLETMNGHPADAFQWFGSLSAAA